MKRSYNTTRSEAVVRAALARGTLTFKKSPGGSLGWRYGRRAFANTAVSRIIASGEAVREGNVVRMVDA
jgi:hypothetical protein